MTAYCKRIYATFLEIFDANKEIVAVNVNWAAILAFVFFWTYGFFGAVSSGDRVVNTLLFIILTSIFLLLLFLWKKCHNFFEDRIVIRVRDIFVLCALLFILFPLSFANLNNSVVNDGLAHAQQAESHAINLIQIIYNHVGSLGSMRFSNLIWIINLCLLVAGAVCVRFFRHKKFWINTTFYLFLFAAFRGLIVLLGGSGSPHPPFRLFPLWLGSALFSPADISFRLAQFFGLLIFGLVVYKFAEKRIGFLNSFLLAFSAITIPVLWHVGILVEQSLWAAIAWSAVLIYMFLKPELTQKDYLRLFALVSMATLMRQTAFVALVPIAVRLAYDVLKKNIRIRDVWIPASPLLVMMPFLLHGIMNGTPVSYVPGGAQLIISADVPGIWRVVFALRSGAVWTSITNSVQGVWLFFAGLALIFSFKRILRFVELISLLASGIVIFYLVTPGVWGVGRYQAEYVVPFAILGIFCAAVFLKEKFNVMRYVLPLGFIILSVYNIYIFKRIPALNLPMDKLVPVFNEQIKKPGGYSILSEFPYNYREALTAVRESGYAGSMYLHGSTYGAFPQILGGFSVADVAFAKNLMGANGVRSGAIRFSSEDIQNDKRIQLVLISDVADGGALASELKQLGWKEWKNFSNMEYGSTIYGLIRK